MEIDKSLMKKLRAEIDSALESVGRKNGVRLRVGNGSYLGCNGRFKLEISAFGESGELITPEAQAFLDRCQLYGLKESDLFSEFKLSGVGATYKLLGIRPRARKQIMLLENSENGRKYKVDADLVRDSMQKSA